MEAVENGIAVSASSITDRLVRYLVEARGLDRAKIKVDGHGFVFAAELWTGFAFFVDDANQSIQIIVPLEIEVPRQDYLLDQLNDFNLVGNISLSHLDGTVFLQVVTPATTFVGQHVRWPLDQAVNFARFRYANDGLFGGRAPLQEEAVAAIRKLQIERNRND